MTKFEKGKTYWTRSIGDADCIFEITIAGRQKSLVHFSYNGLCVTRRVFVRDDVECIMPFGRYSMAPTIRADKTARAKTARTSND